MRQFTATAYILKEDSVLLIYHKKLKKWLPPGGHMEPNELPPEAAIREAKEETGLDIELIPDENISIERWNAKSFPRPFMCLLEDIPAFVNQPPHQHMDLIFVGRPLNQTICLNPEETDGIKWFTFEELKLLERDVDIFEDTYQIIEHLLNVYAPCSKYSKIS